MNCYDCNVQPGEEHQSGCDIEHCTHCGMQWIGCGHHQHDPSLAVWTGAWPGDATCRRLGFMRAGDPDLNRLAMEVGSALESSDLKQWVVRETMDWKAVHGT